MTLSPPATSKNSMRPVVLNRLLVVGKKVQLALYPEAPVSHTAVAIWTTDSLS